MTKKTVMPQTADGFLERPSGMMCCDHKSIFLQPIIKQQLVLVMIGKINQSLVSDYLFDSTTISKSTK